LENLSSIDSRLKFTPTARGTKYFFVKLPGHRVGQARRLKLKLLGSSVAAQACAGTDCESLEKGFA
jgi:hypothetical protein